MTKLIHKYDSDLESFLIYLSPDEFINWLETNEIIYDNPNLLEVIMKDKLLDDRS